MAKTKTAKKKRTSMKLVRKTATGSGALAHLKRLQKAWEKADVAGGKAPEGIHQCRIDKFEIKEKDNKFRAVWLCKITGDTNKGQNIFVSNGLAENQLPFLKGSLQALGQEFPRDLSQLEKTGKKTEGMDVEVEVVHNGEYANSNFISLIDDGSDDSDYEEEDDDEEGEEEDDDSSEEEDEDEDDDGEDDEGNDEPKISKSEVDKMDEDQLDELIDENDLDVDLDDYKGIRKQRIAVLAALKEEDLLEK